MERFLKVKNLKLPLNPNAIFNSPLGRPMRLSGIRLVTKEQVLFIDGMYRHCTIYTYIFLDNKEFIHFKFDQYGKFKK